MRSLSTLLAIFAVAFFGGWIGQAGLIPFPGINLTRLELDRVDTRLDRIEERLEELAGSPPTDAGPSEALAESGGGAGMADEMEEDLDPQPAEPRDNPEFVNRAALGRQELTSTDGRVIEVVIITVVADAVEVRRSDGQEFKIPFSRLVPEDQAFLEYLRESGTGQESPDENWGSGGSSGGSFPDEIELEKLFNN